MKPVLAFFIRMLRQQSRDRRALSSRVTVGLLLLCGLWGAHFEASTRGASGRAFFNIVIGANYFLVPLAALMIGIQAIAEEKEAGTLGLLRLTSLSPVSILLGKAGANLIGLLLLLALQIPFALLAVTLGGVSGRDVLTAFALLASTAIATMSLGLVFSVLLSKVWRAALMAFCIAIGLLLTPAVLTMTAGLLDQSNYGQSKPSHDSIPARRASDSSLNETLAACAWNAAEWVDSVLPPTHALQMMRATSGKPQVARGLIAQCLFGVVLFAAACWLFPYFCENEAKYDGSRKGIPLRSRIARFRLRRPRALAIYWKDFHFTFGGGRGFLARLLVYPASIVAIGWKAEPDDLLHFIGGPGLLLGLWIFYFDVGILVVRSWNCEAVEQNLSQLLLVPLPLRRLHLEKALGIAVASLPPLLWAVVAFSFGETLPTYSELTWRTIQSLISFAVLSLWFLSVCFSLSLRVRASAFAITSLAMMACGVERLFASSLYTDFVNVARRYVRVRPDALYDLAQMIELAALIISAVFIFKSGQRQLLRRAAES